TTANFGATVASCAAMAGERLRRSGGGAGGVAAGAAKIGGRSSVPRPVAANTATRHDNSTWGTRDIVSERKQIGAAVPSYFALARAARFLFRTGALIPEIAAAHEGVARLPQDVHALRAVVLRGVDRVVAHVGHVLQPLVLGVHRQRALLGGAAGRRADRRKERDRPAVQRAVGIGDVAP